MTTEAEHALMLATMERARAAMEEVLDRVQAANRLDYQRLLGPVMRELSSWTEAK